MKKSHYLFPMCICVEFQNKNPKFDLSADLIILILIPFISDLDMRSVYFPIASYCWYFSFLLFLKM